MELISGIIDTTQYENITSPQNNVKSTRTNIHKVQQRRSRVRMYTNCKGDYVNLEGGDDDYGDVVVDVYEYVPPQEERWR
jgi:hypothetical protein